MDGNADDVKGRKQRFLRDLCRHLVSFTGDYVPIDEVGRPTSKATFFSYSGFIIAYKGCWFFVTAGHIIENLDKLLEDRRIRLEHCHFQDSFAKGVQSAEVVPFGYEGARKAYFNNDDGWDVALIGITSMYRALLERGGVIPIPMDGWREVLSSDFEFYGILGLASEKIVRTRGVTAAGRTTIGGAAPVFLMGHKSDAVPVGTAPAEPWLAIQLLDMGQINDMDGMSGGPIYGINNMPDGTSQYTAAGIQSMWFRPTQVAFGTPMTRVMEVLERDFEIALATRRDVPDDQCPK